MVCHVFPGEHGCLFLILLIESRERPPRRPPLYHHPQPILVLEFLLSPLHLYRLPPPASEIISVGRGRVSVWNRSQTGKKTPTLTLGLIVSPRLSRHKHDDKLAFDHIVFKLRLSGETFPRLFLNHSGFQHLLLLKLKKRLL